jgi:hypothetical protein
MLTLCKRRPAFITAYQHRGLFMLSEQLLSEIQAGEGEPLARAARRIPSARQGKPVTLSCLLRWILSGVRGPGGQRIKLEAARLANRWLTTPGALRRFVEAQTPALDRRPPPAPRSPSRRRRESEAASDLLARKGI